MPMLSIIIPVYNERRTILEIINRVEAVDFTDVERELVVVDDGSTDGTREILREAIAPRHHVVFHERNCGKGSAIRTGLAAARGDYFVIQDADLEYNPRDLNKLLAALRTGSNEIVYGSRALGDNRDARASQLFHLGGLLVTWWTNALYGTSLTDEATCYKMFTRNVYERIPLHCTGFEFCPELTGKALRGGFTITEVPISYAPRGTSAGKKIRYRDGLTALWTLTKIRMTPRQSLLCSPKSFDA